MSRQRRNPGPIPSRWLNCPRKAASLIVGKFMAFKAPLGDHFNGVLDPEFRFPPKMLFDLCKTKKIKFGLWIDLTNTNRFYNKKDVEDEGCAYVKMSCRGRGETPTREQKDAFVELVHHFIAQHPLDCIAVHCTHGFNRTGFLIVSYLVEKMDCSLERALEMFAQARPPGIYKADYLAELYSRYDDVEDTPPPPKLPPWCFENGEGEAEESPPSTSGSDSIGNNEAPPAKRFKKEVAFMEGVPGVEVVLEQPMAFNLQKKVREMCEWRSKGFPGCQPVSMSRENIKLLHLKPYRVSWKADGMRYMMLIDGKDQIYFFDRDFNVFKVKGLRFPLRKDLHAHLTNTLLDGEMVIDKVNGEDIPRYLAYDIVKFDGKEVGKMPFFPTRVHCLENEIIKPRHLAMESGLINKSLEPFSVRKKDFWEITQSANLLGEKFAKTLSHEPDGLIFQPSKMPYTPGRCDDVLKWKPADLNSVDFRLKIMKEEGTGIVTKKVCYLYVGGMDTHFAKLDYTKTLKDLDNKIIECKFENNRWKFMRQRIDKSHPNGYNTAKAVCQTIKDPVTKELLLDYIERYRFDDDCEIMPPPAKRPR